MPSAGPKCVLAVDDDDNIRVLVGEILKLKGYRVEMAREGLQALAKMASTQPDALVLDLMMPVIDGWTFLERCRADHLCGGMPVKRAELAAITGNEGRFGIEHVMTPSRVVGLMGSCRWSGRWHSVTLHW